MSPAEVADLVAAETELARDIIREHGHVGAIRLAYRIAAHIVSKLAPSPVREGYERFALVPLQRLVAVVVQADAEGRIVPPTRAERPQA